MVPEVSVNAIPANQQTAGSIDLLAAQRQAYSNGKEAMMKQLYLALAGVCITIIVAFAPQVAAAAQVAGFVIVIADLILGFRMKGCRTAGARLQELFDVQVLGIPWKESLAGEKPSMDTISDLARAYRATHATTADLQSWYSVEVAVLPLVLAQVACQRESISWDRRLRQWYAVGVTGVSLVVLALLAGAAYAYRLATDVAWWTILTTFVVLVFPLVKLVATHTKDAIANVLAANELQAVADRAWRAIAEREVGSDVAPARVRDLQDRLYDYRRATPLIHDKIHEKLRTRIGEEVRGVTMRLIEDARRTGWVPALPPSPSSP